MTEWTTQNGQKEGRKVVSLPGNLKHTGKMMISAILEVIVIVFFFVLIFIVNVFNCGFLHNSDYYYY